MQRLAWLALAGMLLMTPATAQTGFTTLITMVLFLGGVQLMALGLLGEYVGRIYDEVKKRPLYLVAHDVDNGIIGSAASSKAPCD